MPQQASDTVAAQVSAYDTGKLYVPTKARDLLNLGYNDGVEVRIPEFGGRDTDVSVRGHLNSSGQIQVGRSITEPLFDGEERFKQTTHIEARIEPTGTEWGDDKDDTDKRWKRVRHLIAELL